MYHLNIEGSTIHTKANFTEDVQFDIKVRPVDGTDVCDCCNNNSVYAFDPTDDIGEAGYVMEYCQVCAIDTVLMMMADGDTLELPASA